MRTALLLPPTVIIIASSAFAQPQAPQVQQQGQGSYFNGGQDGHSRTVSGAPVQPNKNTAASRTLPLGTKATVTDQKTGKSTQVTVTDRGPTRKDRVVDLSRKAAGDVGMTKSGTAPVTVTAKPNDQTDPNVRQQLSQQAH